MDLTTLKKPGDKKEIQKWTTAQEELLAEWSEKATCFRWLHSRSEKAYRFRNYSYTIPVIILSTLTGTANFAMDSFVPDEHKQVAMACVGGVNIFAGILSTLQNFLRYAELMESHRSCEVQWSKFGRNIAVELALDPLRRKPADDFLKVCRSEYDRLIEQSPPIDDSILKQFKNNFKDTDIRKPDICNGLDKCKIFKPSEADKKAEAVASAGQKLMGLKRKPRTWSPVNVKKDKPKIVVSHPPCTDPLGEARPFVNEAAKELDGLLTMSKVSEFKKKTANSKTDKDKGVIENINEIIKNSQTDIETGASSENLMITENESPEDLAEDLAEDEAANDLANDLAANDLAEDEAADEDMPDQIKLQIDNLKD